MLYVYHNGSGIEIQARGSGKRHFDDTWGLAALIRNSDEATLNRFRDRGEPSWLLKVTEAFREVDSA